MIFYYYFDDKNDYVFLNSVPWTPWKTINVSSNKKKLKLNWSESYFLLFRNRLDYNVLQVANPDSTATGTNIGSCTMGTAVDSVVVNSPTGGNPPVICGLNTGQHSK